MSGTLRYAGSKLELEAARGVQCFTIKSSELPVKSGALMPNPSLKRSANGRPPGPVWRYEVHSRQPGPGALPLSSA
jgi:hypothetical protein